ncbi:imidazole glycerol phosphate synthase glutamine amidotransferase subunit [Candidatus Nasuia deltocephalinicola]|uniref:Imidazole glycerol phosphate synthase subunit HisH n=1 Tax=Candidatus Nasuia deltocephalincola TaxID=1160784 RepID=A0A974WLQ0_9PROT|nr:imidazole glycerol phosphate synthase subunit HisH [Candidatus Nasuia deltocephalinicola]WKD87121.1 imidazole glycerol phosphate synthase subunit HisH [Candidatus Nasuia deltocephalinicola]BEH03963.1 imidazole glycerol phosphate synthase glutamine amidotransferase subunit [Candidatus Nasuia deltocephalinicola]
MNIGILDTGIGNLKSIIKILKTLSVNLKLYLINKKFKNFIKLDKLIIPGQGSSYNWIKNFLEFDIFQLNKIFLNLPILGICVGKQIFFNITEEFNSLNLNYINGLIKKFFINKKFYKIPHIGWNNVYFLKKHNLLKNFKNFEKFYYSHSYYLNCEYSEFIYGFSKYNFIFNSIFIKNNLFLTQFHPEKSGISGINLFYNFYYW